MINQKLLAATKENRWSYEVASAKVGVSRVTFSRWVNGHQEPQPTDLQYLCDAFGMTAEELGYGHLSKELIRKEPTKGEERKKQLPDTIPDFQTLSMDQSLAFTMLLKLGETMMFDPKKRETIQTLLTVLGIANVKPEGLLQPESWQPLLSSETDATKINETTMLGYKNLLQSCWQLSRGNELALAEELLPPGMNKLVPIAQQPSKYQQAAANLTAQGFRLYSIFALHKNNLLAGALYDKQAAHYSRLSGDQNLLIVSLRGLGNRYYYLAQYPQALQTYLEALQHGKGVSPLLQACIYMSLAVAYAHIDQKQDAFTYLGQAYDIFPDYPETDPSFSHAEFDSSQMILWEGIARSALGQTTKALDIFKRAEHSNLIIPERVRIEILNQQAKTAIASGDMEQGLSYVEAGVTGARTLNSQRRYNEAYENFKQMSLLWPQEKRVKALGELFYQ